MRDRCKCQKGIVGCVKKCVFVEIIDNVGQKWKILTSTQNKHKPTLKTADSGCHQMTDPIRYNTMTQ